MFAKTDNYSFGVLIGTYLNAINELLKKALNDRAHLEVESQHENTYDAILHHGIQGPINIEYLERKMHKIFRRILFMRDSTNLFQIEILAILDNHQYLIRIKNIPPDYFVDKIKASINDYIESLNHANKERRSHSLCCFNELFRNGLTRSLTWTAKAKGDAIGVVLHRNRDYVEKKVFVKRLEENEYLNFSSLFISKICGVKAPKVKLKNTLNAFFLFSSDMNRSLNNKTYSYNDLTDYFEEDTCFLDLAQLTLFQGRTSDGRFNSYVKIDRLSVARFLLMAMILQLTDLHIENVGLVVSERAGICKAKIALVDLRVDVNRKVDFSSSQDSISHFIKEHLVAHSLKTEKFLLEFAKKITNEDYIKAFEKIDAHFLQAYTSGGAINNVIFDRCKLEAMKQVSCMWCENFQQLQQRIGSSTVESYSQSAT